MNIAFALGNGQSRRGLDLNLLADQGRVYGCNRLYQDFDGCTALVATDRPMALEIQRSGYAQHHRFYTRQPVPGQGACAVPKKYYGSSSGPIALALACLDGADRVYVVGHDLAGTPQGTFNNVYADQPLYKRSEDRPTFTGNWQRQLSQVMRDFPDTEFIRVLGAESAVITDFLALPNYAQCDLEEFGNRINNTKDL